MQADAPGIWVWSSDEYEAAAFSAFCACHTRLKNHRVDSKKRRNLEGIGEILHGLKEKSK